MWLQVEGFLDKFKGWWQGYIVTGNPDFILSQKLRLLKKDISTWNKEVFGKVETQRTKALNDLLSLDQAAESRILSPPELSKMIALKTEIQQLALAEETSWR